MSWQLLPGVSTHRNNICIESKHKKILWRRRMKTICSEKKHLFEVDFQVAQFYHVKITPRIFQISGLQWLLIFFPCVMRQLVCWVVASCSLNLSVSQKKDIFIWAVNMFDMERACCGWIIAGHCWLEWWRKYQTISYRHLWHHQFAYFRRSPTVIDCYKY